MEKELDFDKIKNSKDLALMIKSKSMVIIKISASWCGPCKNKKFLESYHKLKSNFSYIDSVKFIELDVDEDCDIITNKKYYDIDIDSVPTFLISKNGSFTKKYIGCGFLNEINDYLSDNTKS